MILKTITRRFCPVQSGALRMAMGLMLMAGGAGHAASTTDGVDFQEVYQVLKGNLAGFTETKLNEAAVRGLLAELGPRVSIVEEGAGKSTTNATQGLVSTDLFDGHFACFRVRRLATGAGAEIEAQYDRLRRTNELKGVVLDLRYVDGQDYPAALALADRFIVGEMPLVDWGDGWKKSVAKTNAITLPVALLVNHQTSGAAEALAGILRNRDVGLIIGTNTAGQANMAKVFTLKSGQHLRVAVAPLKVADGLELPLTGIKPDIEVAVSPADELAYYADAYRLPAKVARTSTALTNELQAGVTNRGPRRRLNEAELVRMSRDGQAFDRETNSTNPTPPLPEATVPTVTDPALARALDLLKGLAVVQQFRAL